jgi:hypothetical protein
VLYAPADVSASVLAIDVEATEEAPALIVIDDTPAEARHRTAISRGSFARQPELRLGACIASKRAWIGCKR